jgi:AraC family transcriptional regulator, transcriptional activator of pobA
MFTTPKSFEYHNFLRDVLRQSDSRAYFLASEEDFMKGALPRYPYRNYFYGIGLIHEGHRTARIGAETFRLEPGSVMTIGPSIIRQWLDDHFNLRHEAIFFTTELFNSPINAHFLTDSTLFKANIQHVTHPVSADFEAIAQLFKLLKQYRNQPNVVAALVLNLIELLTHLSTNTLSENTTTNGRSQTILREFDGLLLKHYLENKDVAFYAEKLQLTASHLSETIKTLTGKSAKKRIDDILMLEAKSLLKQTDMSIKEITYWLGFDDPSYFVKFFKQAEGVTPNVYRSEK